MPRKTLGLLFMRQKFRGKWRNMATDFNSPSTPSRHEKSLGLLTAKFVALLQEAKDGVLDLKMVNRSLFRRLYV